MGRTVYLARVADRARQARRFGAGMTVDGQNRWTGRLVGGRYRLAQMIGRGRTGFVWRARDEVLGRALAIKHLPFADGLVKGRREARMAARVAGPHVVRIFDLVCDDGEPWIAMELLSGRTLADLLVDREAVAPSTVAGIALDLLSALRAVHAAGIVHRDVTPRNVLLDGPGRAVLSDFGLATDVDDPGPPGRWPTVGSPAARPPHGARVHRSGTAGDLWSVGATLRAVVQARARHAGDCPAVVAPLLPLIRNLLDPDPACRPTAEEAWQTLLLDLAEQIDRSPPAPGRIAVIDKGVPGSRQRSTTWFGRARVTPDEIHGPRCGRGDAGPGRGTPAAVLSGTALPGEDSS